MSTGDQSPSQPSSPSSSSSSSSALGSIILITIFILMLPFLLTSHYSTTAPGSFSSPAQPITLVLSYMGRLFLFIRDNSVLVFFCGLLLSTGFWLFGFTFVLSRDHIYLLFRSIGVNNVRTKRAFIELKRKSFHLLGLLIPIIYYFGMKYSAWLTQTKAAAIMSLLTLGTILVEIGRFYSPSFHRLYSRLFHVMMRKTEMDEDKVIPTGMGFFFLGNTLCVFLFEPLVATAASLYLVLGDMTAAIVGISFGRTKVGRKSIEGSFAMWLVCLCIGTVLFWNVDLGEYPIFVGASVATVAELLLPSWINDNLSIPLCAGVMLHLSFRRIAAEVPMP